jgi:hypothetical protein
VWLGFTMAFALTGCAGPPIPGDVKGEPTCRDFELGATREKMQGGLRFPVQVTVKEGSSVQAKALVLGLRGEGATPTRFMLPDGNSEFDVEWAQCPNERAPRPITGAPSGKDKSQRDAAAYECGEPKVYKTDKLVTRKHAPESHTVVFAAPPNDACWTAELPEQRASDDALRDGGATEAADAAAPSPEAASATDAGPDGAASSSTDAGTGELTDEQAIERAMKAAKKAGRDPDRFKPPTVQHKGAAIIVRFAPKEKKSGDAFSVMVSATTGDAKVMIP